MTKFPPSQPRRCEDAYLTTDQVASMMQMSKSFWEKLRCRGGGPEYVKVGGRVRYHPQDVRDFMRARVRSSTSSQCLPESAFAEVTSKENSS